MFAFQVLCSLSVRSVHSLHCFSTFSATRSRILLWSEMYIKRPVLLPKIPVDHFAFSPSSISLRASSSSSISTPSRRTIRSRGSRTFDFSFKRLQTRSTQRTSTSNKNSIFPCLSSSLLNAAVPFLNRDLLNHPLTLRSNLTSLAFSHARPTTSLHSDHDTSDGTDEDGVTAHKR